MSPQKSRLSRLGSALRLDSAPRPRLNLRFRVAVRDTIGPLGLLSPLFGRLESGSTVAEKSERHQYGSAEPDMNERNVSNICECEILPKAHEYALFEVTGIRGHFRPKW